MPQGHNTSECLYAAQEALRAEDYKVVENEIQNAILAFRRSELNVNRLYAALGEVEETITNVAKLINA